MKEVINKNQRLQLIGILTLAQSNAKSIKSCEKAIIGIVGKVDSLPNYAGLLSDAIFEDDFDIDEILKNMGIKVK
jgi:hypothetical protein